VADGDRIGAGALRALEALLDARPATPPRVVAGPGVENLGTFSCPAAAFVDQRELTRRLRSPSPPDVVVLARESPTLLRALREHPPALVVALDGIAEEGITALASIDALLLGPGASLRIDAGRVIACAPGRGELEGLCRALGAAPRVALAPTPPWLWRWLEADVLDDLRVAGYVPAPCLDADWAKWARRTTLPHVLVPLGVEAPAVDEPRAAGLESAVAAHTLERLTGPVFPAPRAVALVLRGLTRELEPEAAISRDDDAKMDPAGGEELMVWAQARRALPVTGATLGMERPLPSMPLRAPTAAFLAQRALLRVSASSALLQEGLQVASTSDAEGVTRALEILQGAAEVLSDHESKVVLRGFGIEVTRQAVASSASGATGFAERIGYPVVLKALSPDLRRRSDVGGVMLGLDTAAAVRRAYAAIVDNVERLAPTARLDGVLVSEMVDVGLDIHCGGVRTATGDVVLYGRTTDTPGPIEPALGLGGLQPDDALLLAHAVLSRLALPALRRETDPDVHGLAELFLRLDDLFAQTGDRLLAVDLGPVRWIGPPRGYVTLDARITQRPHLEGR
jgi:hypothetical protein